MKLIAAVFAFLISQVACASWDEHVIGFAEKGHVPDFAIRAGIRFLLNQRLSDNNVENPSRSAEIRQRFVNDIQQSPVAVATDAANEQHYEIPAEFFGFVMGKHRKYSCCLWNSTAASLDEAEEAALVATVAHAELEDGMRILELGCGWGSLSLYMAAKFPNSKIVAVSNSHSQRQYIEAQAQQRGLTNLQVVTKDATVFEPEGQFDRVVSVEMFEHMRNWPTLFERISRWLLPGGKFFMHVFVHRSTPYLFIANGPNDWMSAHFFTGGMMPSDDLAVHFQDHLQLQRRWSWSGFEYEHTSNAWLNNMDRHRDAILPILKNTYGEADHLMWFQRWRIFFMACAELFAYNDGAEWFVSHYLFQRR